MLSAASSCGAPGTNASILANRPENSGRTPWPPAADTCTRPPCICMSDEHGCVETQPPCVCMSNEYGCVETQPDLYQPRLPTSRCTSTSTKHTHKQPVLISVRQRHKCLTASPCSLKPATAIAGHHFDAALPACTLCSTCLTSWYGKPWAAAHSRPSFSPTLRPGKSALVAATNTTCRQPTQ